MLPSSPEGLRAFDQILLDSCLLLRPPEHLTVSEWSDKYAVLSAEGAAAPGKWYTSNAEYQREPMDAFSDPRFQTVVLMWASQVGKTQIALNFCAYAMEHDPGPILFVEPTEDLAKVIVKDRIRPMLRDTPALKGLVGAGRASETYHMAFPGGQLSMAWANSPSQLASRPIRYLITDEEDRYDANKEGDPVDQARKRMATFKSNRMHGRISSPALRRTSRINKAYETSDQRQLYLPCSRCNYFQVLRFEQIKGTPDDCCYVCETCAFEIDEADKHAMLRAGEWRAAKPIGGDDGKTAGFQLSSLYSPLGYTWGEILADYNKTQGIPDKLQVFTNTVLALPWDEQAEGADLNAVQRHAESYPAQAPGWVVIVTCGADVQKNRIEGTKWGWGLDDQSGVLEHRIFEGDPIRQPEVWWRFEEWRSQRVEHETGLRLPTACTFVDSGDGNRTQAVYDYTRKHEPLGVRACKGSSLNGAPLVSRAKRVGRQQALLVMVGTSTAKDTIYARLGIEEKSRPGYIHFPLHPDSGCDKEYFQHLTAEKLVTTRTKGGERATWENTPGHRNEALDCAVYALAAKEFTRANLKELARKLQDAASRLSPEAKAAVSRPPHAATPPWPSSASSAASPSPQPKPKKRRKVFRRPGQAWIHGS